MMTASPDAKRGRGRPVEAGGKQVAVYLDKASMDTAARLGGGNASAGIRLALRLADAATSEPPNLPDA